MSRSSSRKMSGSATQSKMVGLRRTFLGPLLHLYLGSKIGRASAFSFKNVVGESIKMTEPCVIFLEQYAIWYGGKDAAICEVTDSRGVLRYFDFVGPGDWKNKLTDAYNIESGQTTFFAPGAVLDLAGWKLYVPPDVVPVIGDGGHGGIRVLHDDDEHEDYEPPHQNGPGGHYLSKAPTTNAPTTASPTTSSPTTASPTTSSPTTASPTTSSSTTISPTTMAPTTSAPTTTAPTTTAPTTTAPTTTAPTTAAPTSEPPVSEDSIQIVSAEDPTLCLHTNKKQKGKKTKYVMLLGPCDKSDVWVLGDDGTIENKTHQGQCLGYKFGMCTKAEEVFIVLDKRFHESGDVRLMTVYKKKKKMIIGYKREKVEFYELGKDDTSNFYWTIKSVN